MLSYRDDIIRWKIFGEKSQDIIFFNTHTEIYLAKINNISFASF
jgi:hypothetical protein